MSEDNTSIKPESYKKQDSVTSNVMDETQETKQTRRIITEDVTWSLEMLPRLSKLCLDTIIEKFVEFDLNVIDSLAENDKLELLNTVSLKLPLEISSVVFAEEELFWKRKCCDKFTVVDVSQYSNCYRRMYFEKTLKDIIENYIPNADFEYQKRKSELENSVNRKHVRFDKFSEYRDDRAYNIQHFHEDDFKKLHSGNIVQNQTWGTLHQHLWSFIGVCGQFIHKLNIEQLLCPIESAVKNNDNLSKDKKESGKNTESKDNIESESDSDSNEETMKDHLDFGLILPKLSNLTHLSIEYRVKHCGMNFTWSFFKFTQRDCMQLARALQNHKQLQHLSLTNSGVTDDQIRVLIAHLMEHPSLQELNVSHNNISDRGARALGKILTSKSKLTSLSAADNEIGVAGLQAIAFALTKNDTLISLDLHLNSIGDVGGQAIGYALVKNQTLQKIDLSGNNLSKSTAEILSQVIMKNKSIISINISANKLGPDGGKCLREGMEKNSNIINMDIRLTDCGQEVDFSMEQVINRNRALPENVQYNTYTFDMN
ncbi:T-complex-associated testis-expressed protein 1 [Intoshia linei]|uniref:T-complex-associated testis-expressed protein 1 n=1 Tax=Intoshia linei TaxID=1819745 RepID=A0A177BA22_9BILA|nr:T-complex-associated testis-expressed protein 1 [Intoshia linei]